MSTKTLQGLLKEHAIMKQFENSASDCAGSSLLSQNIRTRITSSVLPIVKEIPNEHFKLLVEIKDQLAPIRKWFGNPCEDYCEGCPSCDAWKKVIIFLTETPDSLTWGEEE
jgi:hypothetical protein